MKGRKSTLILSQAPEKTFYLKTDDVTNSNWPTFLKDRYS